MSLLWTAGCSASLLTALRGSALREKLCHPSYLCISTCYAHYGPCRVLKLSLDGRCASPTTTHYTLDIPIVALAAFVRRPARRIVALEDIIPRQARRVLLEVGIELLYHFVFAKVVVTVVWSAPSTFQCYILFSRVQSQSNLRSQPNERGFLLLGQPRHHLAGVFASARTLKSH